MDERIHQWINKVKDVANEAIIILEQFSALQEEETDTEQGVSYRLSRFICICKKEASLYGIGKEIESVRARVVEIKNKRVEYGIADVLANPKVQRRKRTLLRATSFENEVDVVGFEKDTKTLLVELLKGDPSLGVISIHGMGGLGKSTLASKLYHSSKVMSEFRGRTWVCVSKEYNIKDVLKAIIKSLMQNDQHEDEPKLLQMDLVDLLQHLRKLLQGRGRYLAVIDDIWDIEAWEMIKKAFPDKNNGSRVIITTRNKKLAHRVDDKCFVHELSFLSKDESWKLFCERAMPPRNLENLGKDMVGKCGGLPLAIVVLSGVLVQKKCYEHWSKVKDRIWKELKEDSVEIEELLSLSYDDLSPQMRHCFLYLARFPEDYKFEIDKLKLLWVAEEFISEPNEGDEVVMEDVADDYLNELINRNMIQIALFLDGEVVKCSVHDLVRDLAIEKAKTDKLLGTFDSSKQNPGDLSSLQVQPRHAINNGTGKYFELLGPSSNDTKLRSLALIINGTGRLIEFEKIRLMYTSFRYLKVLDFTGVNTDGIPKEIGDLILLKFLGLTGNSSCGPLEIPPTIGKLKRLQTLCGSGHSSEYDFPSEICQLKDLRHLDFLNCTVRLAEGSIGRNQKKLQTLGKMWFEDWIQIHTLNLSNLRTLSIKDEVASEKKNGYRLDSITNLKSLQTFSLESLHHGIPKIKPLSSCKRLKTVKLLGRMKDPSDLKYLPDSVSHLTLMYSGFKKDPMPTLGSMSNLTVLDLDSNAYMMKKMVCRQGTFPSLQILKLSNLPNLVEWKVEDGVEDTLPCLHIIKLCNVKNLVELQVTEGALSSLKAFEIIGCDKLKTVPERVSCLIREERTIYPIVS